MKKSEFRRLVAKYKEIKTKHEKTQDNKLKEQLREIEHRYLHETGSPIVSDTKEIT